MEGQLSLALAVQLDRVSKSLVENRMMIKVTGMRQCLLVFVKSVWTEQAILLQQGGRVRFELATIWLFLSVTVGAELCTGFPPSSKHTLAEDRTMTKPPGWYKS